MSIGFTIDRVHSEDMDIRVLDVINPPLPENQSNRVSPSSRIGDFNQGTNIGAKTITIEIEILGDDLEDLSDKVHTLADWIIPVNNQERELVLDTDPDKTYYGNFEGATDMERRLYNGIVTLSFVCSDPYAYSEQQEIELASEETTIQVQGSQPTAPIIRAVLKEDITYLAVATEDRYIYLGEGVDPDSGQVPVKPAELVFNDPMNIISTWIQMSQNDLTFKTEANNGIIDGSFIATGNVFRADDYGVGVQWHGPMAKRVLPASLDNWKVSIRLQNSASAQAQQGKLEVYLLNEKGEKIATIQIKDNDAKTEVNILKATIGEQGSTVYPEKIMMNTTGQINKVYKTVSRTVKVKGKAKTIKEKVQTGAYSGTRDFYGYMNLTKEGNKFTIDVIKLDSAMNQIWKKTETFIDQNNIYTKKLAQIAIYAAAWSTRDPNKVLDFANVRVDKINIVDNDAVQVIAQAGDELFINNETQSITKNGEEYMLNLDIASNWILLNGGEKDKISIAPFSAADWTLFYRPRGF